jgi:hypothetical protein
VVGELYESIFKKYNDLSSTDPDNLDCSSQKNNTYIFMKIALRNREERKKYSAQ